MKTRKIVISPENKKAIAFIKRIQEAKEATRKKIEAHLAYKAELLRSYQENGA